MECTCYFFDEYRYDNGIIDVDVAGEYIQGGKKTGFLPYIDEIWDGFYPDYYENHSGTGNSDPQYYINSIEFVDTYAVSDYEWINVALPIGAIFAYFSIGPVLIPELVVTASYYYYLFATSDLCHDAYAGYNAYLYVRISDVQYTLSNGMYRHVPLMYVEVVGWY